VLLFCAVLAGVTVLRAQETTPAASPPAATAGKPDPQAAPPAAAGREPADEAAAKSAAEGSAAKDVKPAARVGPTRDRFEPTEKVRADFDVSFPVDI
jgi:hypothetical protein